MSEDMQVVNDQSSTHLVESAAIMSVIERVAMSPDADISKLEKMLEMQERVLDRNAKQAFTSDLSEMQQHLPRIIEHGEGHNQVKYARLEDINDKIRPVLYQYGFAITFRVKVENNLVWITTVLSHRQGHSEETSIPLALDTSGGKNAVQAAGSSISYGKRYGICAMLNISTGDDVDGGKPEPIKDNDEPQKHSISDARLTKAIGLINGGEYKESLLNDRFILTVAQAATLKQGLADFAKEQLAIKNEAAQ